MASKRMRQKNQLLRVWKLIFTGIATVAPLLGTLWVLYALCRLLLRVGRSILAAVSEVVKSLSGQALELNFPGVEILHLLVPLLLLLGLGLLMVGPVGRAVVRVIEAVVGKVPVIGFIYKSLSQFVGAIKELGGERKFKSVVYVEYPSPGCRLLGFVTGNFFDKQRGKDATSVFVPTSPNPLTGFLLVVDDDKIQPSGMTVEEATKIVLSAGLVTPKA